MVGSRATTPTGKVKRFDRRKGYGFIAPDHPGNDLFVHVSGLASPLTILPEGALVEYDVRETRRGRQAVNVTVINTR